MLRIPAVGGDDVYFRIARCLAYEHDVLAVGGPVETGLVIIVRCNVRYLVAVSVGHYKVGRCIAVGTCDPVEGDPASVGRPAGIGVRSGRDGYLVDAVRVSAPDSGRFAIDHRVQQPLAVWRPVPDPYAFGSRCERFNITRLDVEHRYPAEFPVGDFHSNSFRIGCPPKIVDYGSWFGYLTFRFSVPVHQPQGRRTVPARQEGDHVFLRRPCWCKVFTDRICQTQRGSRLVVDPVDIGVATGDGREHDIAFCGFRTAATSRKPHNEQNQAEARATNAESRNPANREL